jgi:serine/threonine protein kinase/tetratricopeptide (TPR) repeat protein
LQAGLGEDPSSGGEDLGTLLLQTQTRDTDWRFGNYLILEEIGRGGMGVIYRARQRHSRRVVALKRILSYHSDCRETLHRFRREAEAAASLDHPNILPIYEVSESDDGFPFFSMKFAAGGSLSEASGVLQKDARLCVALMAKVARALEHAHEQGIVHRDLKPGNILLDSRGEPFVSDFGLAKWLETNSDFTRTLMIFGTPGYIAPEQAQGGTDHLSPLADIYSLGAILFELLAGRPPFLGPHALSVIQQASQADAPKLRSLSKSTDRDLETICARCLEREPTARYASAGDLAADLERWLQDRPIAARPVLPPARLWRWSKRNPVLASTITICFLLGAATLARYEQTRRLEIRIREQQAATHSVAVTPFLDLDEIAPDVAFTSTIAQALGREMSLIGPNQIALLESNTPQSSAAGYEKQLRDIARQTRSRAVLTGTRRRVGAKLRVSLHFIKENGVDTIASRIFEIDPDKPNQLFSAQPDFISSVYRLLDRSNNSGAEPLDKVMANERARAFMVAGRDLLSRRTIPEMERAIACFEGAIREEPKSPSAHSFLAMACMGRDLLSSDRALAPRALQVAREAVVLGPTDPTANRALCGICASNGLYSEALEHGLRSVEFGDPSGRAFGQIAYTWRVRGRPDKAIRWYGKARASQQESADFDALIGDCWADVGQDSEAQRHYESAATFRPDQPEGWLGLARLKLLKQDYEGARQICRAQILHYPDAPITIQFAALIEFFSRNFDEANRLYRDLERTDPLGGGRDGAYGAVDYRSAIARLRMQAGDGNGAHDILLKVVASAQQKLRLAPEDAETLYRLSAAEAMLGQTTEALTDLRGAIAVGWIDYRSARLDPRFDRISATAEFDNILSELAARMARIGRQSPAVAER